MFPRPRNSTSRPGSTARCPASADGHCPGALCIRPDIPTMGRSHSYRRVRASVMALIEADGLTKTYRVFQKKEGLLGALRGLYRREFKEVKAVDGVRFSIEPGEMVAFLGPNGAGKTTTLKMLSGLINPT